MATPFALLDGETLSIGAPQSGFRSYLAVRGGVDAAPVLGSRSTDTMSGIGPAPLAAGQLLAAGGEAETGVVGNPELQPDYPGTGVTVLDVVPGPRADWFDQAALDSFAAQDWAVLPQSNRVGMRLDGTPLQRTRQGELPSEGTVAGALQVPPEGLPVLFLADHPITGGYPVIAVVVDSQLDLAAQVPIGGRIRFRWAESATTEHPTEHALLTPEQKKRVTDAQGPDRQPWRNRRPHRPGLRRRAAGIRRRLRRHRRRRPARLAPRMRPSAWAATRPRTRT